MHAYRSNAQTGRADPSRFNLFGAQTQPVTISAFKMSSAGIVRRREDQVRSSLTTRSYCVMHNLSWCSCHCGFIAFVGSILGSIHRWRVSFTCTSVVSLVEEGICSCQSHGVDADTIHVNDSDILLWLVPTFRAKLKSNCLFVTNDADLRRTAGEGRLETPRWQRGTHGLHQTRRRRLLSRATPVVSMCCQSPIRGCCSNLPR